MNTWKSHPALLVVLVSIILAMGLLGNRARSQTETTNPARTLAVNAVQGAEAREGNGRYQVISMSASSAYFLDTHTRHPYRTPLVS